VSEEASAGEPVYLELADALELEAQALDSRGVRHSLIGLRGLRAFVANKIAEPFRGSAGITFLAAWV
jgi:hypothetical protein